MSSILTTMIYNDGYRAYKTIIFLFIPSIVFIPSMIFVDGDHFLRNTLFIWFSIGLFIFSIIQNRGLKIHCSPLFCATLLLIAIIALRNHAHISLIAPYLISWIALVCSLSNNAFKLDDLVLIIELSSGIQIIICILQWLGFLNSGAHFRITGTFENPSGLSLFFTISSAFLWDGYLRTKKITTLIILLATVVFTVLIASRSGIIALLVIGYISLRKRHKLNLFHNLLFLAAILVLIVIKFESSLGRSLIIWGCKDLIIKNWLFGSGIFGFSSNYMKWQCEYFQTNPNTDLAMLAGNVMHPLNEYIALAINTGIVGIIALIGTISYFLYKCRQHMTVWSICLIVIIIQSFFTYSFRYAFVWFFTGLCLSQIIQTKAHFIYLPLTHLPTIASISLCIYALFANSRHVCFEYKWGKEFNRLLETNQIDNSLKAYSELEKDWTGNPFFLYNLAAVQHLNCEFEQSNNTLKHYNSYVIDYNSALLIADNHYSCREYDDAIIAYKNAYFMCPSKFIPLQGLLNTYHALGDTLNLRLTAKYIVNKPVKINSQLIEVIKAEAHTYLKSTDDL